MNDQIRAIIDAAGYGVVATCVQGQPRARPMSFVMLEDGRLWSSTYRQSGKVAELEQNAHIEICFVAPDKVHLRVAGVVDLSGGEEKKARLLELNPKVKRHFPDAQDPKFVHVEVVPTRFRWKPSGFNEYQELQPTAAQ